MGEDILLAGLLLAAQQHSVTPDPQYNDAIKHAALASYKQAGMDKVVDREVKVYEDWYNRKTSKEAQMVLGYTFWAAKVLQDRKIVYGFTF